MISVYDFARFFKILYNRDVKIISAMRDILWFYGFKIFYKIKHPKSLPLIFLMRVKRILKRNSPELAEHDLVPKTVPKKIWIFWAQGWENAPLLCKVCKESWILNNPDWEVIALDQNDIASYVQLDYSLEGKKLTYTNHSNILRLAILSKNGGVWADPTTFCNMPLNEWLPPLMQTGFFAFKKIKTTIADWFLASEKKNFLIRCWEQYANLYWKYAKEEGRYFWPHYLFEYLIRNDRQVKTMWLQTPQISSQGPYTVQKYLKEHTNNRDTAVQMLFDKKFPIHKLDWRIEVSDSFLEQIKLRLHKNK